jgi:hypothetical protein
MRRTSAVATNAFQWTYFRVIGITLFEDAALPFPAPLIRRHRHHVVKGEPQHNRFYLFPPCTSVAGTTMASRRTNPLRRPTVLLLSP